MEEEDIKRMTFKELRKSKGLTMGKLAEKSGVSAKTISQYEQSPPVRPGKKVLGKISGALGINADELKTILYPDKKRPKGRSAQIPEETGVLEEAHVIRIVRLIDKEIEELRYLLVDCANLASEHQSMNLCLDSVQSDIEILTKIKGTLLG
jgi:transcriptional regulator with XRE-family HTH domain